MKNKEFGHRCYISPLSDKVPRSDKVIFVFYDFETTQDTKCTDTSFNHVPKPVCVRQFCTCAKIWMMWKWIAEGAGRENQFPA